MIGGCPTANVGQPRVIAEVAARNRLDRSRSGRAHPLASRSPVRSRRLGQSVATTSARRRRRSGRRGSARQLDPGEVGRQRPDGRVVGRARRRPRSASQRHSSSAERPAQRVGPRLVGQARARRRARPSIGPSSAREPSRCAHCWCATLLAGRRRSAASAGRCRPPSAGRNPTSRARVPAGERARPGDRYAPRPDPRLALAGRARPPWRRRRRARRAGELVGERHGRRQEGVERVLGHLGRFDRHPLDPIGERREAARVSGSRSHRVARRRRRRARAAEDLDGLAEPEVLRASRRTDTASVAGRAQSRSSCAVKPTGTCDEHEDERRRGQRCGSAPPHVARDRLDVGPIVVVHRRVEGDPDDVGLADARRRARR